MGTGGGNIIVSHSCQSPLYIKWTVTGKVSDVIRTNGSSKPDLHFDYDATGQRIAKTVTNKNVTTGDKFVTTYYVRDPQGNVLAVYEHKHGDSGNGTFTLAEQHLYGASRLGMKKRDLALNVANASEPTPVTHYELTNHLGNVMAVISDKASATAEPTVVSLSDYYPFGMTEPGRNWNSGDYRFGYTGHEKENDLAEGVYTTEYRLLDTRLGKWLSVDPLFVKYPDMSSYNYCGGNPVLMVDVDGRSTHTSSDGTVVAIYDDDDLGVYKHEDKELEGLDKKTMLVNGNRLSSDPEQKMGETWTPFGFANFEAYEKGNLVIESDARIDFESDWGSEKIQELAVIEPNWLRYAFWAQGGSDWDYKFHTPGNDGKKSDPGYGSKLFGKYASARDVGNFGAGLVAAYSSMPKSFFEYGYGSYNVNDNNKLKTAFSVMFDMMLISTYPNQESGIDPQTAEMIRNYGYKRIKDMRNGEHKLSRMGQDAGYYYIKGR